MLAWFFGYGEVGGGEAGGLTYSRSSDLPVCPPPPGPKAGAGAWKASYPPSTTFSLSPLPDCFSSSPAVQELLTQAVSLQCFTRAAPLPLNPIESSSCQLTHSPCLGPSCAPLVYLPHPELFFSTRTFLTSPFLTSYLCFLNVNKIFLFILDRAADMQMGELVPPRRQPPIH